MKSAENDEVPQIQAVFADPEYNDNNNDNNNNNDNILGSFC